jgi:uncharacterized protein (TIGR03083 family)
MPVPHGTIAALSQCFASITSLCETLNESEWKTTTDCPGWSIQDNLSHLIGIERMLEGLPPTTHKAAPAAHVKNPIGESNENEIDSRRHRSGTEVLAEWKDISTQRMVTLRNADDAYFDAPAMTPTGPGTLADFLSIRVLDSWVHEQDMRRAVGKPGNLGGPAAEHTVDRLLRTVPIVVGKRAGTPEGASVFIDITGGVTRRVVCTVTDGRAAVVADEPTSPLAHITMDVETFVVLATGRRTANEMGAQVLYAGDAEHGRKVTGALNMMI